jgi:addiction module RelE/StbE family toxin
MEKLKAALSLLIAEKLLPASCLDHPLKGEWRGFQGAHIEPDWLLIYKVEGDVVRFERTADTRICSAVSPTPMVRATRASPQPF